MILRPYQKNAVQSACEALEKHGNTLVIAPTGAGKTIMLSSLIKDVDPSKALVLQHRAELTSQNLSKYKAINPGRAATIVNADQKNWSGDAVFAMVQTLVKTKNLDAMPKIDLAIIDEAHHVVASSYLKILDRIKDSNPDAMIAGFTATPARSDKKGLRKVFSNVAYNIPIKTLIDLGFLVTPIAYTIDIGKQQELSRVKKTANDYDMAEVEKIMNTRTINAEVVRIWCEKAGDRPTVVFTSTVDHAVDVAEAFNSNGIPAAAISGGTPPGIRAKNLEYLKTGKLKIIVNCAVLTEGFDEPSVSCVVLLRPCSDKSVMIQMIGRGLRVINEKEYPGMTKTDCIVLDFGISLLIHGNIDADTRLFDDKDGAKKICPEPDGGCGALVPAGAATCPLCGYEFVIIPICDEEDEADNGCGYEDDRTLLTSVTMTELDIMNSSPFRWVDLFGTGKVMIASGFGCFATVASKDGKTWVAIGKRKDSRAAERLFSGAKIQAVASADDFMRCEEESDSAKKASRWMTHPATIRQGEMLKRMGYNVRYDGVLGGVVGFTKLTATAHLNFSWNKRTIEMLIGI